ncbi:hypothetical protein [Paraburkholderia azotifigens]|uniref:Integrase n=1 Tax=Paraburkholderia azotifigens TaxID=2057004 RepID=A0ABU9RFG1_9BURK
MANSQKVRIHGVKRVRVETPEQYARRLQLQAERKARKRAAAPEPPIAETLYHAAEEDTVESCERYFTQYSGSRLQSLRPMNWLSAPTRYVGREHVNVASLGEHWFGPMLAWLDNRVLKGFETESDARQALVVLADYLFLYLPWWIELHPGCPIEVPTSPKEFSRFFFVSRMSIDSSSPDDASASTPRTLLEMLALRRPSADSFNLVLVQLERFFQFVITAYEANDQVAGPKMSNPIRLYFDKRKGKSRTKTNKVPFDETTYPHLVHFSQAVEAFGEYLQQLAYDRYPFGDTKLYARGYDTETWGYVPIVCYRGRIYPIRWIPNVFGLATREFHMNPEGAAGIYVSGTRINTGGNRKQEIRVPHLTVLRLLMGLIETGLRGQGIQWLDRKKWDSMNDRPVPISALYTAMPAEAFTKMYVNTDKSKDGPWTTFISWRVRRSFLAEQFFQESIAEGMIDAEVPYEYRESSRFESVVPLFRGYMATGPYHDATYVNYWRALLLGFQVYYNSRVAYSSRHPGGVPILLQEPAEFFVLVPRFQPDGVSIEVTQSTNGPYCAISWLTVNTPHACRATYASLRDGDLEVSEIAEQLGHENELTTTGYQIPSESRLREKLQKADRKLIGYAIDGSSEELLHPESPRSAVRQSFARDRNATIDAFGFVNGVTLWSTDELTEDKEDALELLRASPASVIAWHPTHACPVGNQCPRDIIPKIGGPRRCGLCPLAAKCVDHLPAIAAKKNELRERIVSTSRRIRKMEAANADPELIAELYRQRELDTKEFMGWELSEQILYDQAERLGSEGLTRYHVDSPELVRLHLERVSRNPTDSEFFLQRIAESNAYPSMETPEVRARAARYIRAILARAGYEDAATTEIEPYEELRCFASLVKPFMDAKGYGIDDLAKILAPTDSPRRLHATRHPLLELPLN